MTLKFGLCSWNYLNMFESKQIVTLFQTYLVQIILSLITGMVYLNKNNVQSESFVLFNRGLGEGWRELKVQTHKIAEIHDEASKNFSMLEQELNKFIEDQKKKVAQVCVDCYLFIALEFAVVSFCVSFCRTLKA